MYNKSEIMKKAWELFKSAGWAFSVCLRMSWKFAKEEAAKNAPVKEKSFVDGMTIEAMGYEFTLKRWTKHGMDRVYLEGCRSDGCGYVDLVKRQYHPKTNFGPAKMASDMVLNMVF